MSTTLSLIVGGVILLVFAIRKWFKRNDDYWDKRGVLRIKHQYSFMSVVINLFTKKKNFLEYDIDLYNQLKSDEPFAGTVDYGTPSLLLKDSDLIKQILVKDFEYFVDRRKMTLESEPILKLMMSVQEGQEWKNIRSIMSPTFTTGKIRRMFEHFNNCGVELVNFIKSKPVGSPGSRDIVVKEAISRYLVDVIGATAFGMETNSLKDPNSMFYKMAKRSSEFSTMKLLKIILMMVLPFLTKLGLKFSDTESWGFFEGILRTALKNRIESKEKREDFLQMMIEAKMGELKTDESELEAFEKDAQLNKVGDGTGKPKVNLTDDMIVAQCLLFFLAGLDTTGSVLSFAAYLLALHPDIQEKLYQEVNGVMKGGNGKVDYDAVTHMEYMDKFISEIMRMYPPGVRLERRANKDYKIPGTNVTLEKDTIVFVSVLAIHRNPEYYPDPEKFDPERFTPEAKAARNAYTYLPFGSGPRNCKFFKVYTIFL
ncbi:Cytochrome P450 6k1 [Orchesella cincta]|uniref:Cytochrome P450 6k1 n=1 Tax=Orchesella cincta TaxID=48709 RepID=A0A1D2N7Q4_ORCCI|nr:Cytochrome P450 6k1 [Orchesella cincta]